MSDGTSDECTKRKKNMKAKVYLKRIFAREKIKFGDTKVAIYQLVQNATFTEMFGDLGKKRWRWKDQEEALAFAQQNRDKLCVNGNFFELDRSVAVMHFGNQGKLGVYIKKFSPDEVWHAESGLRVIYPQ